MNTSRSPSLSTSEQSIELPFPTPMNGCPDTSEKTPDPLFL